MPAGLNERLRTFALVDRFLPANREIVEGTRLHVEQIHCRSFDGKSADFFLFQTTRASFLLATPRRTFHRERVARSLVFLPRMKLLRRVCYLGLTAVAWFHRLGKVASLHDKQCDREI